MCEIVNSLVGPILSSAMPTHELIILHIAVAFCFRPSATRCRALLQCDQFKTVILKVSYNSFPPVAKSYISLASVWVYECTLRRNHGFFQCTVKPRQFTEAAGMMTWQTISQLRVGWLHRLLYAHSFKKDAPPQRLVLNNVGLHLCILAVLRAGWQRHNSNSPQIHTLRPPFHTHANMWLCMRG